MLNTDCRAHELDSLYVVGTSFNYDIGAVNPALPLWPMPCQVGDHLLQRLGAPRPAEDGQCRLTREMATATGWWSSERASAAWPRRNCTMRTRT